MKRALLISIALLIVLHTAAENAPTLAELRFRDLYDRDVSLKGDDKASVWVLFFFSNTCPVARRYMPRIAQLEGEYRARGVRFVGINASPADTLSDIAEFARDFDIPYPVLKDVSFEPVKTLGITRTPEVAVLDKNFSAVYRGRIDDQYRLGGIRPSATRHDLVEALEAVLTGRMAPSSHVPAEGCAITYPDSLVSEPETHAPGKEPELPFSHEFRLEGAGESGKLPGTREWDLTPIVAEETWLNAIEVKGPAHGVSLFYLDAVNPDKRHYVAGALASGQRVQWRGDEGVRIPSGARLRLSVPSGTGSDLTVHVNLLKVPPAREVRCSLEAVQIPGSTREARRLIQALPTDAVLRSVAVGFAGYGAALTIEQVYRDQTTETLLDLPILDPTRPAVYAIPDSYPQRDVLESICATLQFPGYLQSPWPETPVPQSTGAADDALLSLFLYWSLSE